jgi:hypothetical protein
MAEGEEEKPNPNIVLPGQQPAFPVMLHGAEFEGSPDEVAAAAWKQSNGSIEAFEQLCRDHVNGSLDLLAVAKAQEEGATAAETPQHLDAPEEHPARRRGRRTAEE